MTIKFNPSFLRFFTLILSWNHLGYLPCASRANFYTSCHHRCFWRCEYRWIPLVCLVIWLVGSNIISSINPLQYSTVTWKNHNCFCQSQGPLDPCVFRSCLFGCLQEIRCKIVLFRNFFYSNERYIFYKNIVHILEENKSYILKIFFYYINKIVSKFWFSFIIWY
jgi:hypothetical protein